MYKMSSGLNCNHVLIYKFFKYILLKFQSPKVGNYVFFFFFHYFLQPIFKIDINQSIIINKNQKEKFLFQVRSGFN